MQQLKSLARMMRECPDFELVLMPKKFFEQVPINMVGAQGQFFVAWLENGEQSALFPWRDDLIDMAESFNLMWDSIPAQAREREENLRILNRIIRHAEGAKHQKA